MNLASAPSSAPSLPAVAPLAIDHAGPGLFRGHGATSIPFARDPQRHRPRFTLFPLSFLCTTSLLTETPPWGFFSGRPKVEFLNEGGKLRLLGDFCYTDPSGRTWLAPAASIVDEFSLPHAFWARIGRPFARPFLYASIIHDAACEQKGAAWPEAHLGFYHALRSGGASESAAKALYYAAYHFGPRWGLATACAEVFSALGLGNENLRPLVDGRIAAAATAWIEKANPSLEQLRATKPAAERIH